MNKNLKRAILSSLVLAVCLWVGSAWVFSDLAPKADSGQIGLVVAKLLEQHHYSAHPLDDEISRQFFTNYFNALDYNHLIFLQSDLDQFKKYDETLDDSLLAANVTPAFEIFACYSNRV